MRAGDMSERITLKNATITHDDYGAEVENWNMLDKEIWAEARYMPAKERYNGDRVLSVKVVTFFTW